MKEREGEKGGFRESERRVEMLRERRKKKEFSLKNLRNKETKVGKKKKKMGREKQIGRRANCRAGWKINGKMLLSTSFHQHLQESLWKQAKTWWMVCLFFCSFFFNYY